MPSCAVPLIVASVFTLGGYAILRAERSAEAIERVLGAAFLVCTMVTTLAFLTDVADRRGVHVSDAQIAGARAAIIHMKQIGLPTPD